MLHSVFIYLIITSILRAYFRDSEKRHIYTSVLPSRVDSSVSLTHHDRRDIGLICLVKKRKIHFRILSNLRIQSWIFLKKRHPKLAPNLYHRNYDVILTRRLGMKTLVVNTKWPWHL